MSNDKKTIPFPEQKPEQKQTPTHQVLGEAELKEAYEKFIYAFKRCIELSRRVCAGDTKSAGMAATWLEHVALWVNNGFVNHMNVIHKEEQAEKEAATKAQEGGKEEP